MKKVTHTAKQQARRARALERFKIDQKRAKNDPNYLVRKEQELQILKQRLGVQ